LKKRVEKKIVVTSQKMLFRLRRNAANATLSYFFNWRYASSDCVLVCEMIIIMTLRYG